MKFIISRVISASFIIKYCSNPICNIFGSCAFASCTNLTSAFVGKSVTLLAEDAFSGCTGLINITFIDSNDWYLNNRVVVDVTDSVNVINLLKSGELFYKWVY